MGVKKGANDVSLQHTEIRLTVMKLLCMGELLNEKMLLRTVFSSGSLKWPIASQCSGLIKSSL